MARISAYKSDDGVIWEDRKEYLKRQRILNWKKAIADIVKTISPTLDAQQNKSLCNIMFNNRESISKALR